MGRKDHYLDEEIHKERNTKDTGLKWCQQTQIQWESVSGLSRADNAHKPRSQSERDIQGVASGSFWMKQIAGACIFGESSRIFAAALSRATQVPLIVYVLNAEPLECIHF